MKFHRQWKKCGRLSFTVGNRSSLLPLGTCTQARSNRKLVLWSLHDPNVQREKAMTRVARGWQLKAELQAQCSHPHASAFSILWNLFPVLNLVIDLCKVKHTCLWNWCLDLYSYSCYQEWSSHPLFSEMLMENTVNYLSQSPYNHKETA